MGLFHRVFVSCELITDSQNAAIENRNYSFPFILRLGYLGRGAKLLSIVLYGGKSPAHPDLRRIMISLGVALSEILSCITLILRFLK